MKIINNIILFCITLLILLLAGEYVIRYAFRDITTTGHYSYFSKKWWSGVRTNKEGFREKELEPENPQKYIRIFVIGDSFTFGQGIEEKDRFSNLLDAELNRARNGYEVLNFGRPGAETVDETLILKKIIGKFQPDYVLLQWYKNDVEGSGKAHRPKGYRLFPSDSVNGYLMGSSAFYTLASMQWGRIQEFLGIAGSYEKYMLRRFGDPESIDSKNYTRELTEFIDLCKSHNIPMGIVLFPELVPNLDRQYPYGFLHDRVLSVCRDKGIQCLDLREVFSPYTKNRKERMKLYANRLDSHPSALANRIAADSIMKYFGSGWRADPAWVSKGNNR
jgi:hypothetical protein